MFRRGGRRGYSKRGRFGRARKRFSRRKGRRLKFYRAGRGGIRL